MKYDLFLPPIITPNRHSVSVEISRGRSQVVSKDGFSISLDGHPVPAHAVRRLKGQDLLRVDGDLPRSEAIDIDPSLTVRLIEKESFCPHPHHHHHHHHHHRIAIAIVMSGIPKIPHRWLVLMY